MGFEIGFQNSLWGLNTTAWILAVLLPLLALWIRSRVLKFRYFFDLDIPGPKPSLLDGNASELMKSTKDSWLVMTEWIKKYGTVFGYYKDGPERMLVVADQEMLKTILIKDFAHFSNRSGFQGDRKKLPVSFRESLVVLTGDDWKRVRNTLSPTFTARKMKTMSPKMNDAVDVLLSILEEKCTKGEIIDVYRLFQALTLDVIGKCAFAMDVNCQKNPNDPFFNKTRDFLQNPNSFFIRIMQMFPEFKFFTRLVMRALAPLAENKMQLITGSLQQTIQLRKSQQQTGNTSQHTDMIQLMIEANLNTDPEDGEEGKIRQTTGHVDAQRRYLTNDEIIGNSFIFLLAGFETTATCMGFTCALLVNHPDIQERLYEEIVELFSETERVDYEQAQNAPYLEMVFSESLRLFPPVTSFVTRVASTTVEVNGHVIPEGTGVEVPVWYLHHDPEVWDQPYDFNPERFSAQDKPSINPMSYMPFGAGPRNCIGMRFALLEIKIALIRILQRYRLDQCEKTEPEIRPQQSNSAIKPKEVFLRLTRR